VSNEAVWSMKLRIYIREAGMWMDALLHPSAKSNVFLVQDGVKRRVGNDCNVVQTCKHAVSRQIVLECSSGELTF
jgi:hypothetical protein